MWLLAPQLVAGAFLSGAAQPVTHPGRSGLPTCSVGTRAHTAPPKVFDDERAPQKISEHVARWASTTPSVVHGVVGSSVLNPTDRVIGRRPPQADPPTPAKEDTPPVVAAFAAEPRGPMSARTPRSDDPVKWYLKNIGKQRLLTPEEVNALARRIPTGRGKR